MMLRKYITATAIISGLLLALQVSPVFAADTEAKLVALLLDHRMTDAKVRQSACKELGEMKKLSDEGIRALVKGLFIRMQCGGLDVRMACFDALLHQGPAAVPTLIDVLSADPENKVFREVLEYAGSCGTPEFAVAEGQMVPRLLALIRDERAAMPLLDDLARPIVRPAGLRSRGAQDWMIGRVRRMHMAAISLMSIGSGARFRDKALRLLRSPGLAIEARLELAMALAFKADRESTATLFRVIYEKTDAAKTDLPPPVTSPDFVSRVMLPLAYSLDAEHLALLDLIFKDEFDRLFGDENGADFILEVLAQKKISRLVNVVRLHSKDPEQLLAMLGETRKYYSQVMAHTKAALMLSRAALEPAMKKKALALFVQTWRSLKHHMDNDDLRRALLLAMERQGRGDKGFLSDLDELLQEERKKALMKAASWNQELTALRIYLARSL